MLKELLLEIREADYISKAALATKLGQPMSLVEDAFERLVHLGYLREEQGLQDCDLPCGKCPYASLCTQNPIKTMSLTEKGQRFLARQNQN